MAQTQSSSDASRSAQVPHVAQGDFRFLSACVQGIEIREAWARYESHRGSTDLRHIRATARHLIDTLYSIGRRHGVQGVGVLKRDPARIADSKRVRRADVLTLDMFREGLDDPDFYSEAEVLELWRERYGGAERQRAGTSSDERRARLVRRQLEVLWALEHLAASAPQPDDALEAWLFSSPMARRLRLVGISTLSQLVYFIRLHGYRWYRKVPKLGEAGAKRLVEWLRQHEETLGSVSIAALAPRTMIDLKLVTPRPSTAVVPLERFLVPAALSGEGARNRAPAEECDIAARDDYAAIQAWLAMFEPRKDAYSGETTGSPHTWRAYRKEAERLLLWAVLERSKPLSALDASDLADYQRHLAAPAPMWVGARSATRWSEHWRPFEGPLSPRSRQTGETILKSLFSWLTDVRYLRANPWVQVRGGAKLRQVQELRSLSDKQWVLVDQWLQALPPTSANQRLRFMFRFAFSTGMREAELAHARASWLYLDSDDEGEVVWNLRVVGKGGKERELPLPSRFVDELADQLRGKGFDGDFESMPEDLPLLSTLKDPMRPMDEKRVYELMKAAFVACADAIDRRDPQAAARIRRASPHWLRHTHGRKWVEAGGDRGILRDRLGHASIVTTGIYDRSDIRRQRGVVEKIFG